MTCPICASSKMTSTNGCALCGYYPTQIEIGREEAQLLAKVRAARNRSRAAVEWGGLDLPKDLPVNTNQRR